MCLICSSFKNNELTLVEAWRNFGEMKNTMEPKHVSEVFLMLLDASKTVEPVNILPAPTIESITEK